jgi:hypothetical protein
MPLQTIGGRFCALERGVDRAAERGHWDFIMRQCRVMLIGCPSLAFFVLLILFAELAYFHGGRHR